MPINLLIHILSIRLLPNPTGDCRCPHKTVIHVLTVLDLLGLGSLAGKSLLVAALVLDVVDDLVGAGLDLF